VRPTTADRQDAVRDLESAHSFEKFHAEERMPKAPVIDLCWHIAHHDRPDRDLPQPNRRIVHPAIGGPCRPIKVKRLKVEAQPAGIGFIEHDRSGTRINYEEKINSINKPIDPELSASIGEVTDRFGISPIILLSHKNTT
jgi:hypothetical protein